MSTIFVSFTSSVPSIPNGGNFVLSWNVTGAKSLDLSSSDGLSVKGLDLGTMLPVTPSAKDAAVVYTLTATDPAGTITTDTVTVNVGAVGSPGASAPSGSAAAILSFTSSSPSIPDGGSLVLSWNVTGAQSVAISSSDGSPIATGLPFVGRSPAILPTVKDSSVVYTLTAMDPQGRAVTSKVTVAVGFATGVPGPGGLRVQPLPGLTSPKLSAAMTSFGGAIAPMPLDGYNENMTPAQLDAFIKKSADKYTSNGTPLTPAQLALVQAREKAFEDAYHAGPGAGPADPPPVRRIFSATGLPPGMNMSEHGELNGTPTVAGVFPVTVKLIDSLGNTVSSEVIPYTVNPAGGTLAISPTSLPAATQGVPHSVNFTTVTK